MECTQEADDYNWEPMDEDERGCQQLEDAGLSCQDVDGYLCQDRLGRKIARPMAMVLIANCGEDTYNMLIMPCGG